MAVEDECQCSDSSEPSNLTSLQTDISSTITSSEMNNNGVFPTESSVSDFFNFGIAIRYFLYSEESIHQIIQAPVQSAKYLLKNIHIRV